MKVWIDRDACESNLAACESCFGQLVITGVPDRPCIMAFRDDNSDTLTVYLHSETHQEMLIIPPELRKQVAYNGLRGRSPIVLGG